MRTVLHLSDLHFNKVDPRKADAVLEAARTLAPHLVVISGDLTQRARSRQFIAARRFLDQLPKPQMVVPGNHDIPTWNIWNRVMDPLTHYRQYISPNLEPTFMDTELIAVGVNTTRVLTSKYGRINALQIRAAAEHLRRGEGDVTRMIVAHHPFDVPASDDQKDLVGRSALAMRTFARSGVDLFLGGHLHRASINDTARRYRIAGHSALVVQAGTAISGRLRGEANSWNVLRIFPATAQHARRIEITPYVWDGCAHFAPAAVHAFRHTPEGWFPAG